MCGRQVKLCDPSLTRAIPEHLRDESLIIKRYTNKLPVITCIGTVHCGTLWPTGYSTLQYTRLLCLCLLWVGIFDIHNQDTPLCLLCIVLHACQRCMQLSVSSDHCIDCALFVGRYHWSPGTSTVKTPSEMLSSFSATSISVILHGAVIWSLVYF